MDPQQDLVTLAPTGRAHLVIRPLPGTIAADFDKKWLRFRCDFNLAFFNQLAEMLKASVPVQVESRWLSGLCSLRTVQVFGDRDHNSLDIELRLIEVVKARKTPEVDPVTVSGAELDAALRKMTGAVRFPGEPDVEFRARVMRDVSSPIPMTAQVSVPRADSRDAREIVEDVVSKVKAITGFTRMTMAQYRSGIVDGIRDDERITKVKGSGMAEVDRAIALADSTGENPGSKGSMLAALVMLPGVANAEVYDCADYPEVLHPGCIAVVVDRSCNAASRYSVTEVAAVIHRTRSTGVTTMGSEQAHEGSVRWFTSETWAKKLNDDKGKVGQVPVTPNIINNKDVARPTFTGQAILASRQINTNGQDIRPGTAVFTETCARCERNAAIDGYASCSVCLDAEAEAHKARCFVKGDRVRWMPPGRHGVWLDGTFDSRNGETYATMKVDSCHGDWELGKSLEGTIQLVSFGCLTHLPQHVTSFITYPEWKVEHDSRVRGHAVINKPGAARYMDGVESSVDPCRIFGIPDMEGPVRISASGSLPVGLSVDKDYAVQNGRLIDPLDVEYDDTTLRALIERDLCNTREGKHLFRSLSSVQRDAVSAYHSAQLRIKVAKSEADRKARETTVVISVDPEDL